MTKSDRANFGSKLGVILASAGSAVGLGNIWRFPFETGNHGGAAFIFVYLVCVLILGIPIMIAEFLIGRRSRANTARAYQKLAPGTHWRWVGRMGVLAGFLILGYYSVVAGWTLEFIGEAATNSFAGKSAADFIASFNSFVSNPWRPVIWLVLFLLAVFVFLFSRPSCALAVAWAGLVTILACRLAQKHLGGMSGDVAGFSITLGEASALLILAVF